MDADTKKREPGCTCHQEEGDSECAIHGDCGYCGGQMPRCCAVAGAASVHAARLAAAEARAEKAEGEVKYLRAHREWAAAAGQAASRLGSIVIPDWWLAANPEPQPPEGVAP